MHLTWLTPSAMLSCFFVLAAVSSRTFASLGDPVASIENDRKIFRGQVELSTEPHYSIHEITVEETEIREYVSAGRVFAVSWRGPAQPDLSQLLGRYFPEYKKAIAAKKARRSRGRQMLHSQSLVIQRSGHMRDLRGSAYLPKLAPDGFDPKELK